MENAYLDKVKNSLKSGKRQLEERGEYTVIHAYNDSKNKGRDQIVFEECLWEQDVPSMIKMMRKAGIQKFVISSGYSNLINSLVVFEDNGCRMMELTKVVYIDNRFGENEEVKINGILFEICEDK